MGESQIIQGYGSVAGLFSCIMFHVTLESHELVEGFCSNYINSPNVYLALQSGEGLGRKCKPVN